MKKLVFTTCTMLLISAAIVFISCEKGSESELPKVDENGLTKDITDVVPIEIINEMKNLGMPIYGGNTPPMLTLFSSENIETNKNISRYGMNGLVLSAQDLRKVVLISERDSSMFYPSSGSTRVSVQENSFTFHVSPVILLAGNNEGDTPGSQFYDCEITLSNQNNKLLTIDFYQNEGSGFSTTRATGAFIVGTDCLFTIFAIMDSEHSDGGRAQTVRVVSGQISPDGVNDYHMALFMLNDYGDINDNLMEIGNGRVFHDSDEYSNRHVVPERTWHSVLPPCPANLEDVRFLRANHTNFLGCFDGRWEICPGVVDQDYHYGATTEVRWLPSARGNAGQQCTYDENGDLITGGLAAGSPDIVSPGGCGWRDADWWPGHYLNDVLPYEFGSAVDYLTNWPANNILARKENIISGIFHMRNLVGNMTASEIITIIKNANAEDNKYNIHADLKKYILGEDVSLTDAQILEYLRAWEKNVDNATGWIDSELENKLDKAIENLESKE